MKTPIEDFHSPPRYINQFESGLKVIDFQIMGCNFKLLESQIKNDLENLFINEDLCLVGGAISPFLKEGSFKFFMYKLVDEAHGHFKFDLEVDTLNGELTAQELEVYLNEKYKYEHLIFLCVFPIYNYYDSAFSDHDPKTLQHIVIFQNLSINYSQYHPPLKYRVKSRLTPAQLG